VLTPPSLCLHGNRMSNDDALGAATTILYSNLDISPALVARFGAARTGALSHLTRGLTSHVYRLPIKGNHGGDDEDDKGRDEQGYCLKRVLEDDEMPPHSIRREMMCYRAINEEKRRLNVSSVPIITLLAAFRDESDPFSVEVDLIMPLYPCTLDELMDEPSLQVTELDPMHSISKTDQRPARLLAYRIQTLGTLAAFIQSCAQDLFSALSFLHNLKIAHRDIKPSNILIDPKYLSLVLIDFGTCYLHSYEAGDDGRGGLTSEVGTGAYRAPESLFSPLDGYDVYKLDVWQAGVTLLQFFLPLRKVEERKTKEEQVCGAYDDSIGEDGDDTDDRQEWEKALWADDAGLSWSNLEQVWNADRGNKEQARCDLGVNDDGDEQEGTASGWKRETLFNATRGDLGLANDFFDLLGLPKSTQDWPEAEHFQPTLDRMPFPRRAALAGGVHKRLAATSPNAIVSVLEQCIRLSASRRISADEALEQLRQLKSIS
jgi:serine/threonine protein kinase